MDEAVSTRRHFLKTSTLPLAGAMVASAVSPLAAAHDFSALATVQGSHDPNVIAQTILDLPETEQTGRIVAAFGGRSVFKAHPSLQPAFSFDWGDGTPATGPLEISSHVYDRPGRFTVTLTMTTPQGQELRASKSITITRSVQPPADALALLGTFTQKILSLPLDTETASAAATALQLAQLQASIAKRHRSSAGISTLRETSESELNTLIADTHSIDAATAVETTLNLLTLARERGQVNDRQFQDIIFNNAIPLMFALTDPVRLDMPDGSGEAAAFRRGIRYRLCVAKCHAIAAVILVAILAVAAGAFIGCLALASPGLEIPVIGFILILLCFGLTSIALSRALGVLNRWLTDCISRC